jgi:hypothetical protein
MSDDAMKAQIQLAIIRAYHACAEIAESMDAPAVANEIRRQAAGITVTADASGLGFNISMPYRRKGQA